MGRFKDAEKEHAAALAAAEAAARAAEAARDEASGQLFEAQEVRPRERSDPLSTHQNSSRSQLASIRAFSAFSDALSLGARAISIAPLIHPPPTHSPGCTQVYRLPAQPPPPRRAKSTL